jgi:type III secretion protein V
LESAFPVLVARAKEKLGLEQITRVLRKLASEEISIRNLRAILEHLLEFDYIRCDSARLIVLDDRMPTKRRPDEAWLHDPRTLADFVRTRLKRYISYKHTRGGATLAVYLLDPEIEELLATHDSHRGELPEADRARVFAAIAREVRSPLSSPLRPVLLTSVELRSPLRRLIQTRFPHLPVLCFQELSPDSSIQPIGKITL